LERGKAYLAKGILKRAIKDLSKAIQLDGGDALAYLQRSLAYEKNGDSTKAAKDYNKAIQLDPSLAKGKDV
jgi:Tfp pilus assembly protein PilF